MLEVSRSFSEILEMFGVSIHGNLGDFQVVVEILGVAKLQYVGFLEKKIELGISNINLSI